MSIFVLVLAALLLGLMDWAQAVMESWAAIIGFSSALLVAALFARDRFVLKLSFVCGGVLGFAVLGVAYLIGLLVAWSNANVQPLG